LPIRVAASYSGLSCRRLWTAMATGELPRVKVPGSRHTLVDRLDVDRWLASFKA
jgi:hypothetical protein